jgi:hypothetical protein
LELQRGNIILVKNIDDDSWWYGEVEGTGAEGYFPITYVTVIKEEEGEEEGEGKKETKKNKKQDVVEEKKKNCVIS